MRNLADFHALIMNALDNDYCSAENLPLAIAVF